MVVPALLICFHCGEPGHHTSSCPNKTTSTTHGHQHEQKQTAAGREAFRRYIKNKIEFAKQHQQQQNSSKNINDDGLVLVDIHNDEYQKKKVHFNKVVEWMKKSTNYVDADTDTGYEHLGKTNNNTQMTRGSRDPVSILQDESAATEHEAAGTNTTQRWIDLHNAKCNNVNKAYRSEFNRIIDKIRYMLAARLDVTSNDIKSSTWQGELKRAVILGSPADFSYSEVGLCLKVYAIEKLQARCRQLHHLLFNDDKVCSRVRSLLVPLPTTAPTVSANYNDNIDIDDSVTGNTVNVISLGGGPGYDHVALTLVAKFLHDIQPHRTILRRRCIRTRVFDLFDKDWEPIMKSLSQCLHETLENDDTNNDYDSINTNGVDDSINMTMHHADLRWGLDNTSNRDLAQALETVDIICIQFCLHENASFIKEYAGKDDHEQQQRQRLRGIMRDIFNEARIGTKVIITDSAKTLFPLLKCTAKDCGWGYYGDEELRNSGRKLTFHGPKSYVILERLQVKYIE